jgi:hypothetical protein
LSKYSDYGLAMRVMARMFAISPTPDWNQPKNAIDHL